ncbi:MAG: hypothetical protein Q7S60_02065 [bacterium]|nr:hypothetical protein [bacterium]
MTKYREYFERMLEEEKSLFAQFRVTHDKYAKDPDVCQEEFNRVGAKIQDVIRHWENRLCNHSEAGGYGKYSAGLAEKFRLEVRKLFPKIDNIGLIIKNPQETFAVKKINLS